MWVIFNRTTGEEIDRVATVKERAAVITALESDERNQMYGFQFSYRWEA